MELIIAARFGPRDPRLTAINEGNRRHYREQQTTLERLYGRRGILTSAYRRISYTTSLLQLPAVPEAALERLRRARSFEQEALEIWDILRSLPFAKAQAKRASGSRIKIGPYRISEREVIRELISKPDHRDMPASEIWPHFFSKLRDLECEPTLVKSLSGDQRKETIRFKYFKLGADTPTARHMTFGKFQNVVSELRQESR